MATGQRAAKKALSCVFEWACFPRFAYSLTTTMERYIHKFDGQHLSDHINSNAQDAYTMSYLFLQELHQPLTHQKGS